MLEGDDERSDDATDRLWSAFRTATPELHRIARLVHQRSNQIRSVAEALQAAGFDEHAKRLRTYAVSLSHLSTRTASVRRLLAGRLTGLPDTVPIELGDLDRDRE